MTVAQVMAILEHLAPAALAEPWDRVGLQVGDPAWEVDKVLVSLGVSKAVLAEARDRQCGMVVAHHPVIFKPLTAVRLDEPVGSVIAEALQHRIAVAAVHTNLDRVTGGVNDWLAEILRLRNVMGLADAAGLPQEGVAAMGRVGDLPRPVPLAAWAEEVARRLGVPAVRYVGNPTASVGRVACVGGAGADAWFAAVRAGAHCLVTGDVKFHEAEAALSGGLCLVDPGHFGTEAIMRERLADRINGEARRRGWRGEAVAATREVDPFRFCTVPALSPSEETPPSAGDDAARAGGDP